MTTIVSRKRTSENLIRIVGLAVCLAFTTVASTAQISRVPHPARQKATTHSYPATGPAEDNKEAALQGSFVGTKPPGPSCTAKLAYPDP